MPMTLPHISSQEMRINLSQFCDFIDRIVVKQKRKTVHTSPKDRDFVCLDYKAGIKHIDREKWDKNAEAACDSRTGYRIDEMRLMTEIVNLYCDFHPEYHDQYTYDIPMWCRLVLAKIVVTLRMLGVPLTLDTIQTIEDALETECKNQIRGEADTYRMNEDWCLFSVDWKHCIEPIVSGSKKGLKLDDVIEKAIEAIVVTPRKLTKKELKQKRIEEEEDIFEDIVKRRRRR